MITADSIKIISNNDTLKGYNTGLKWREKRDKTGEDTTGLKYIYQPPNLGFKSVSMDAMSDTFTIELSAKILKENYYDLISVNTFDQVVDTINKSGVIEVDPDKLFNHGKLLTVDFCNNLKVSKNPNKYFPEMLGIRANSKYKIDRYNKKRNKGIVVQGNQTSFKERQIMYNKLLDIENDKKLLAEVDYNLLKKQFESVVRIEQNAAQLRRIRHWAETPSTYIGQVLTSEAKPNYSLFKQATSKFMDLTLFHEYEDLKLLQVEKRLGRMSIIEKCNYDVEIIKEFISGKVKGNISQYMREYKELMYSMMADKNIIIEPEQNEYVKEILDLLYAA